MTDLSEVSSKELLQDLQAQINVHLDLCDSQLTPRLCNFRSTPEGRAKIVEDITNRVANDAVSIQQAMLDIEREFNLNYTGLD